MSIHLTRFSATFKAPPNFFFPILIALSEKSVLVNKWYIIMVKENWSKQITIHDSNHCGAIFAL